MPSTLAVENRPYQVFARKYRPQTFAELIGQEHVQKTLTNAIVTNRLAHGYIFSGQRGTGKTTVARILARCLNCVNGPTATPCCVCSSCTEIRAGNSVDVIEIDAASNRGINEMREIRENIRYRPARDRYKVFIIDEAHQITKEAFNALLKTLEEPPEWVVFILCTTEAYEIPNTIASRCQHFSFRSIEFPVLLDHLRQIVAEEGIEADEAVLSVLAQAGEGSVRDSLSALDQAIACCGKTLRVEDVRALLGMFGMESLRAVADAVEAQNGARMLEIVDELESNGKSLQHFCRELSRYWRNLLVAKIAGKPANLIAASAQEQGALRETARLFSEEDLTRYLNLTLDLYKDLQTSLQPRLHMELGLLKLVQAGKLQSIEEALASLGASKSASGPNAASVTPAPARKAPTPPTPATASQPERGEAALHRLAEDSSGDEAALYQLAEDSITDLRKQLHTALLNAGMDHSADAIQHSDVRLVENDLVIRAPKSMSLLLKDAGVRRIVAQAIGKPIRVRIEPGEPLPAGPPIETPEKTAPEKTAQDNDLRQRALSHPSVKRFQEVFPEAQVRTVRNLNE